MARCLMCPKRAAHRHHAVYEQEIRWRHADLKDPRNLVPLCLDCHFAHHGRSKVIPLRKLPDSVFEFAGEVLGGYAYDYMGRRYGGSDARLDTILMGG